MMTPKPVGQTSLAVILMLLSAAAWSDDRRDDDSFYSVHLLVSDGALPADHVDSSLKNPWGIAFNPNGAVWVADNQTNKSTLYDGTGTKVSLGPFPEVDLPAGTNGAAAPTGIVFNATTDFNITESGTTAPAAFIFAGENGTLMGWAPAINLGNAFVAYDDKARAQRSGTEARQAVGPELRQRSHGPADKQSVLHGRPGEGTTWIVRPH